MGEMPVTGSEGFENVYGRYGPPVHGYLARLTGDPWAADELCQETFVRYLRNQQKIHVSNGTLGAWLFRVATNLARDRFRRRRPESLAHEPAAPAGAGDGAVRSEARDLDAHVRREVDRLPLELREVFLLRAHHEMPYARIGDVLDIGERTAKQRFRRAREILAHRLGPLFREERR
jgi:RNA polymerase sigma-70 factor (ECF subfamily)